LPCIIWPPGERQTTIAHVTLEYYRPQTPPRPSGNWVISAACLFAGVVVPAICFTVACFGSPLSPEWQNGEPWNLVRLQLEGKVAWPFFPLLLYSMVSMLLVVVRPARFAHLAAVRVGMYGGVVLAAQYVLIMYVALGLDAGGFLLMYLAAGAIPIGVVLSLRAIVRNFRNRLMWAILAPCGVIALVLLRTFRHRTGAIAEVSYLALGAGPLWALLAYSWISLTISRRTQDRAPTTSLPRGVLTPLAWLGAYGVAWRFAVLRAVIAYSSLPTQSPNRCYVCTAAGRGHARLVGARTIRLRDGTTLRINDQLCRLKVAELALAAVMPQIHRICRRVYDRIGPMLASHLKCPIAADVAYLSLKPAEWLSMCILRAIIKNPDRLARFVYSYAMAR
jgi:hypothetical protein